MSEGAGNDCFGQDSVIVIAGLFLFSLALILNTFLMQCRQIEAAAFEQLSLDGEEP